MRRITAYVLVLVLLAPPAPASAQVDLGAELLTLGVNAMLGGATAAVGRELHGGSFLDGLAVGAAGGAAVYAGKRLNTIGGDGVGRGFGAVGRIVAAVGVSAVRNSAGNRGALDRIILPVGPVSLHLRPGADSQRVAAKLHIARTVYLGHLILDDSFAIDWSETVSAGAPVFRGQGVAVRFGDDEEAGGVELLGAISISDRSLVRYRDEHALLAHERVHVVQDDFITIAWTDPAEDWLLGHVPGGETIGRYVDTGLVYLGMAVAGAALLPYDDRPWEIEAAYLGGS